MCVVFIFIYFLIAGKQENATRLGIAATHIVEAREDISVEVRIEIQDAAEEDGC